MAGINEIDMLRQLGGIQAIMPVGEVDTSVAPAQMYAKYMELLRELFNMNGAGFTNPAALEGQGLPGQPGQQVPQALQGPNEVANDPIRKMEAAKNLFIAPPTAAPAAAAAPRAVGAAAGGNYGGGNVKGALQQKFAQSAGANKKAGTPQQVEQVVSGMIKGNVSPQQRQQLVQSLSNYDIGTLQKLQQEGVSFKIASADQVSARFGGKGNVLGFYDPNDKSITLRNDQIKSNVVIHELAHAEDDAKVGGMGTYKSENDPRLMALFNSYKSGGSTWSQYAKTNVSEYYAEGKAMFDTNPEQLRRMDPALYAYLAQGG